MKPFHSVVIGWAIACLSCGEPPSPGEEKQARSAPSLVLPLADGTGSISLEEQKGKVVLVDLWATWCAPCIAELPHLQELAKTFSPEDFLMLGIVLESGGRDEVQEFIRSKDIDYPNVMGEEGTKEAFGPFLGYPTKYLIDREGTIVKRYFGMVGDELSADVGSLIRNGSLPPVE